MIPAITSTISSILTPESALPGLIEEGRDPLRPRAATQFTHFHDPVGQSRPRRQGAQRGPVRIGQESEVAVPGGERDVAHLLPRIRAAQPPFQPSAVAREQFEHLVRVIEAAEIGLR